MFDIITIEPDDSVVMAAVNTITQGKAVIAQPKDGFRVFARDAVHVEGKGGSSNILIIVGHASADSLSGSKTWQGFAQQVTATADPNWNADKSSVFIAACSTAGSGTKFGYGNFANEIKAAFPHAVVWASKTAVYATDLSGDWVQV